LILVDVNIPLYAEDSSNPFHNPATWSPMPTWLPWPWNTVASSTPAIPIFPVSRG